MIYIAPLEYGDASRPLQRLFLAFAYLRILTFLGFGVMNAVQFVYEVVAASTSRSFTRRVVYAMCTVMCVTRAIAMSLKLERETTALDQRSILLSKVYTVLIIIGTYSIIMQWCAIGSFWVQTFYLFYGDREDLMNPKVRRRVAMVVRITVVAVTVWIAIIVALTIAMPNDTSAVDWIYNGIYLASVLFIGITFSYYGNVLSNALRRDLQASPSPPKAIVVALHKTSFLVKFLAIIAALAIARSAIFTFCIGMSFGADSIGDIFAIIIEIAQMTAVMLAVSVGSFWPFICFRRAFTPVVPEESVNSIAFRGLDSNNGLSYFNSSISSDHSYHINSDHHTSNSNSNINNDSSVTTNDMNSSQDREEEEIKITLSLNKPIINPPPPLELHQISTKTTTTIIKNDDDDDEDTDLLPTINILPDKRIDDQQHYHYQQHQVTKQPTIKLTSSSQTNQSIELDVIINNNSNINKS